MAHSALYFLTKSSIFWKDFKPASISNSLCKSSPSEKYAYNSDSKVALLANVTSWPCFCSKYESTLVVLSPCRLVVEETKLFRLLE
jgi:hypothetical protein